MVAPDKVDRLYHRSYQETRHLAKRHHAPSKSAMYYPRSIPTYRLVSQQAKIYLECVVLEFHFSVGQRFARGGAGVVTNICGYLDKKAYPAAFYGITDCDAPSAIHSRFMTISYYTDRCLLTCRLLPALEIL